MINKKKNLFSELSLLKFLFLISILLNSPLNTFVHQAKAGLEFQWDNNTNFKKLNWFQKDNERSSRNTIYFFLRPNDRKTGLLKINIKIPKNFKSSLKEEKISLCKVRIGGFDTRTKCLKVIPSDIEFNEDDSSLNIFPYSPVPSDKDSYAVVFKVFNPKRSGLYQFHSYGQASGKIPVSTYLGSWTIVID